MTIATTKRYFVYTLTDPRDNRVRWVGQTRSLARRLVSHMSLSAADASERANWLRELTDAGFCPVMQTVETIDTDQLCSIVLPAEASWIARLREAGEPLLNVYGPGHVVPEKTRALIRTNNQAIRKRKMATTLATDAANQHCHVRPISVASRRLLAWRVANSLPQKAAGELVGVRQSTWCDWERGQKQPRIEQAKAIARVTNNEVPVESWGEAVAA